MKEFLDENPSPEVICAAFKVLIIMLYHDPVHEMVAEVPMFFNLQVSHDKFVVVSFILFD